MHEKICTKLEKTVKVKRTNTISNGAYSYEYKIVLLKKNSAYSTFKSYLKKKQLIATYYKKVLYFVFIKSCGKKILSYNVNK